MFGRSLWSDEAATLVSARASGALFWPVVSRIELSPPFYFCLMRLWVPLFPDPVLGLRLFSALCGLASLAVYWRLARAVSPRGAAAAFALACAASPWIRAAHEGRAYALVLLLALACSALLWELARRDSRGRAASYAALAALGLYTHYFFAFLLAAHAAWLVLRARGSAAGLRRALLLCAPPALLFAPWLGTLARHLASPAIPAMFHSPLNASQALSLAGNLFWDAGFLDLALGGWLRTAGALACAALALGTWASRRALAAAPGASEAVGFCACLVLVPLAGTKAAELALGRSFSQARYLLFLSPFLLLWAGTLMSLLSGLAGRALRALFFGLTLSGTAAYAASAARLDPRLGPLSDAIRRGSAAGAPVVHLNPFYYLPLREHYLPERRHYLAGPGSSWLDWSALPGYPAMLGPGELARLGECVVVDPARELFPARLGRARGSELAAWSAAARDREEP